MGFLKSFRGVRRQGDPLLPTLFVIAAKYLGDGLIDFFENGRRIFFALSGGQVLHLAFADDTIIFTHCLKRCLKAIKYFLSHY